MPSQIVRSAIILILVALIPLGLYSGWRDGVAGYRAEDRSNSDYLRSPGCVARQTDVDVNLSPCTNTPAIVVGKSSRINRHDKYGLAKYLYDLSVRDGSGKDTQYHDVSGGFWNVCVVGQAISVQRWRGRVMELDSGDASYSPLSSLSPTFYLDTFRAIAWLIMAVFVAPSVIAVICRLWR